MQVKISHNYFETNIDAMTRALCNIGSHRTTSYVCNNRTEKVAYIPVCVVERGGRQGGRAIHLSCPQLRTNSATKSCPSIDESCEPSKHKKVTCRRRNAKVCTPVDFVFVRMQCMLLDRQCSRSYVWLRPAEAGKPRDQHLASSQTSS
jgi:hypothetical protein